MSRRERSIWCAAFLAAVLALALTVVAFGASVSPVNALNRVEATRAQGFAGAATALGNDPTLVWANPAAAAAAPGPTLTLGGQRGYFDDFTGEALLVAPLKLGALTAGLSYFDAGVGQNVYTPEGDPWSGSLQQDIVGTAGYALAPAPDLALGGLVKAMRSTLGEVASGWSAAVDAGAQWRVNPTLKLGAVVQNLGTRTKYAADPVPSPMTVRLGSALGWQFRDSEADEASPPDLVILATDGEFRPVDRNLVWHFGAEYRWHDLFSVRAGTRLATLSEPSVVAVGAGLKLGGARLDYSVRINTDYDLPQTLSVTVAFPTRKATAAAPAREAPVPVPGEPGPAPEPQEEGGTFAPLTPPEPGNATPGTVNAVSKASSGTLDMDSRPANDLIQDLNKQLDGLIKKTPK